jgi:VIT1/CCC1 family predicted Fe2+/Mn2+ transporter
MIAIVPYLIFDNYYVCLALTLAAAVLIIAGFITWRSPETKTFRAAF